MGGAFSFARGGRGPGLPGACGPLSFICRGHAAGAPRHSRRDFCSCGESFLCWALNLLFFSCDKPFAFCLLAFLPSYLREIFV